MINFDMESGKVLQEKIQEFCKDRNKDEGVIWKEINNMYNTIFERNLMWEKNKYEADNHIGDIPMSQWIANERLVSEIFPLLDEMINVMI